MMRNLLIIYFVVISFSATRVAKSQSGMDLLESIQRTSDYQGDINLLFDEGIEDNYFKHLVANSRGPKVSGYRIRIFSGTGHDAKQRAATTRAQFGAKFPKVGAYLLYDSPDYKVYVGDCRTRAEILKLYDGIKTDFPNAFITPRQEIDPEKYKRIADNE